MEEQPPSSGETVPSWTYQGNAKLDADPATLKGYGKNVASLGLNLQDDQMGPAMLLNGGGDDIALSTGSFPEGKHADQLNGRNAKEMGQFIGDLRTNLAAIPSAALILSDIYETMDEGNGASLGAVQWAFGTPGAEKPKGIETPSYIDENQTFDKQAEKQADGETPTPKDDKVVSSHPIPGGTMTTYRTQSGETRSVVKTAHGTTETGYTKDGTIRYEVSSQQNGDSTTKNYDANGDVVGSTVRTTASPTSTDANGNKVAHQKTTVRKLDENGKEVKGQPATTEHVVTTEYGDGTHSREYYTTEEGSKEHTDERYITRQPHEVTPEDWQKLAKQQMEESRKQTGVGG